MLHTSDFFLPPLSHFPIYDEYGHPLFSPFPSIQAQNSGTVGEIKQLLKNGEENESEKKWRCGNQTK